MVRAKLRLASVTKTVWGGTFLKFEAQYDDSIPEDRRFQKATPNGMVELQVDNPAALAQFELGDSYYVDFTPAPKA